MFKIKYPVSLWFSHDADQVVDENARGSLAGEHLLQLTEAQRRLVVHLLNTSRIKEGGDIGLFITLVPNVL